MPFYDDFEMKRSVENFAILERGYLEFRDQRLPKLREMMLKVLPAIKLLATLQERDAMQEQQLATLLQMMRDVKVIMEDMELIASQRRLIFSLRYYDHIKELAEGGDAEAQRILENIKGLVEDEEPLMN